jgi:hypothetical protein
MRKCPVTGGSSVTFIFAPWPVGTYCWRKNDVHRASCFLPRSTTTAINRRQCFIPGFFRLREPLAVNLRTRMIGSMLLSSWLPGNLLYRLLCCSIQSCTHQLSKLDDSIFLIYLFIFDHDLPLFAFALELLSRFATMFFTPFVCCIWLDISFCFSNT